MNNSPVVNFHFSVDWGGTRIGFSEVSGLNAELEVLEYREGSNPEYTTQKLPGLRKFSNITLKRGAYKGDYELFAWFNTGGIIVERRDIVISLLNEQHEPIIVWKVKNAWPVSVKYAELNAVKGEVLIESLEIAHEGLVTERN